MTSPSADAMRAFRVVVGMDGTEQSDVALRAAVRHLAAAPVAELHLVHAAPTPVTPPTLTGRSSSYAVEAAQAQLLRQLPGRYRAQVETVAQRLGVTPNNESIDVHVCVGAADDAILRVARGVGADLIIVGCHGRRGLARMFVGSVAELVVRRAQCPVLVARPDAYPRDVEQPEPLREGGTTQTSDAARPLSEGFHYHARQRVRWSRDSSDTAGMLHP